MIKALLKSFRAERPRSVHTFPKWDLALVLRTLIADPFEPLVSISPMHLTLRLSSYYSSLRLVELVTFTP